MFVCSPCPDEKKWRVVDDVFDEMRSHGVFDREYMDLKFGFVQSFVSGFEKDLLEVDIAALPVEQLQEILPVLENDYR